MLKDSEDGRMKEEQVTQLHSGFELLAPAGSLDIFRAVIHAGADAVYVGGDLFGARAYARNFSKEELLEAIDYAHLHGRKVYLTVNTLLKNAELGRLYEYLLPFYRQGLDAVLVQDLGVLQYIRQAFPDLPIHTSTQMTVTGVEGARLLKELGAQRIVLSREVSLAEMRRIHEETGVELEAFVHGALCYSYSGQCLFSSMLGGRSGNRGRCAQPCRLPYTVLDADGKECRKDSYVLSLKDMCGIGDLNRLHEAGVYSLKIEGRMKQLSYAAGVVSYYRNYIDQYLNQKDLTEKLIIRPEDMQHILDLGNRCGFTNGYYDRTNGKDMVTFVKPSYEKQNETLQKEIADTHTTHELRKHATGTVTLVTGEPAKYRVVCGDISVEALGIPVMAAQNKPLVCDEVRARMEKTGDTPFVMDHVEVQMEGAVFVPNGALNALRREALEQLKERLLSEFRRTGETQEVVLEQVAPVEEAARVICLIERRNLLPVILQNPLTTTVYLDASAYDSNHFCRDLAEDVASCREAQKEVCLALPRVFRNRTSDRFHRMAEELSEIPLDGVVVRTYEELQFTTTVLPALAVILDYSMYTYNDYATAAFSQLHVSRNTVPLELNRKEIAHRNNTSSEMVVYGYYPLMISAQCVRNSVSDRGLFCRKKEQDSVKRELRNVCYLQDRYHVSFPVKNYCSDCYNVIYNSLPVLLFSKIGELRKYGVQSFRLDFTEESKEEVKKILSLLEEFAYGTRKEYPKEWQDSYTNGHYNRGVE